MHKGKLYPYLPKYWATECWFWPGFLPWKMHVIVPVTNFGPWSFLPVGTDLISEAATTVPDVTQASYHFSIVGNANATDLFVGLEQIEFMGTHYARWMAVLRLLTVVVAQAWLYQTKPQYTVGTLSAEWNLVDNPVPVDPGIFLNFGPATYAEGGSPWD